MPPFRLRLSYSSSTDFSLTKTIIGCSIIASGILAVIIGTILTKGWIHSPAVVYLSDRMDSAYMCNSTAVAPGQMFFYNSTFTYQALDSFSYAGEALGNCKIANGTARIGVYGPPIGSPRIDWELPITCQIDGSLAANFSPVDIVLFNGPDENLDRERRERHAVSLWNNAINTISRIHFHQPCNGLNVTGYKAYEDRHTVDLYPGYAAGVCGSPLYNDTDFNASDIRSLLADFKKAVLDDFAPGGQRIGPLPGLLYACSPRTLVLAPWRQIAFDCFTTAFAVFSPLYAAVIWLLQYLPQDSSRMSSQRRGAGRGEYTGLNEDQGSLPLLPRSPVTPAPWPVPEQPQDTFSLHARHP